MIKLSKEDKELIEKAEEILKESEEAREKVKILFDL